MNHMAVGQKGYVTVFRPPASVMYVCCTPLCHTYVAGSQ